MDFANRGNRPMQQQPAPQMGGDNSSNSAPVSPAPEKEKRFSVKKGLDFGKMSSAFVVFGIAVLLVVLIVGLVFGSDGKTSNQNKEAEQIKTNQYQAVFLNSQDGQVYFGKLAIYNNDLYVLTDIYYVRVENPVQPEGTNQAASKANISLAKLGNELHGPEDTMYISRDKVLFWENLKDDGQVVKAISDYKKNGEKSTSDTTSTTPTTNNSTNTTTQP